MSDETESEVVKLQTKTKPVDQRGLRVVGYQSGACQHRTATFIVDEAMEEVQCGDCGAKLNAHWVLRQLCEKESRWRQRADDARKVLAEVEGRTRTRCQHCDQMTHINLGKKRWSVI